MPTAIIIVIYCYKYYSPSGAKLIYHGFSNLSSRYVKNIYLTKFHKFGTIDKIKLCTDVMDLPSTQKDLHKYLTDHLNYVPIDRQIFTFVDDLEQLLTELKEFDNINIDIKLE